jgi:hypothetical protein
LRTVCGFQPPLSPGPQHLGQATSLNSVAARAAGVPSIR